MAVVLCAGGQPQVGLSIVEAVEIYVVNHQTIRNLYYAAVHIDGRNAAFSSDPGIAFGIEGVAVFGDVPFVGDKLIVIFRVNNGKFALGKGYAAEGVAIAEPAIEKDRCDTQPFELGGNF